MTKGFINRSTVQDIADAIREKVPDAGQMYPREFAQVLNDAGGGTDGALISQLLKQQATQLPSVIGKKVTRVRQYACQNNSNLVGDLHFERATYIGAQAFVNTKLTGLTTDVCKNIDSQSFKNTQLATVNLSSSIRSIATDAFSGCPAISFTIDLGEDFIPGFPWGANSNSIIQWTGSLQKTLIRNIIDKKVTELPQDVSEGITNVRVSCFESCTQLTSVDLPNVEAIQSKAFKGCTNMTTVRLGSQITTIASDSFSGCTKLTSIIINKSQDSVSGAPWGATSATVEWTGS